MFILVIGSFTAIIASEQATTKPVVPAATATVPTTDNTDDGSLLQPSSVPAPGDDTPTAPNTTAAPMPGTFQPSDPVTVQPTDPSDTAGTDYLDPSDDSSTTDDGSSPDSTMDQQQAQAPNGATALCNDGTYSYDTDPNTACEGNGGTSSTVSSSDDGSQ